MCRPISINNQRSNIKSGDVASHLFGLLFDTFLFFYTVGFVSFRIGELIPLVAAYPHQCISSLLGAALVLHNSVGWQMTRRLIYVASFCTLIYLIDFHIPKALPSAGDKVTEQIGTILITGANSGVGYETARALAVTYGKDVMLGCRSATKCSAAAKTINDEVAGVGSSGKAIPMHIDLSDFESVFSLVQQLEGAGQKGKIDVLFNNAGYYPSKNIPVNSYGLNPAFTSMHLSHHLLTELLLKTNNPELRVINTSSFSHHLCAIPFAYLPSFLLEWLSLPLDAGCLDEQYFREDLYSKTKRYVTYFEAKVANVMHAVELPRRHHQSVAVAVDLGWVRTEMQPWMIFPLLGWMRNARIGVLPVLHAIFTPGTELLQGLRGEEGTWSDGGVVMNVFGHSMEAFSTYHWWRDAAGLGRNRMLGLSELLWDTSSSVLRKNGY